MKSTPSWLIASSGTIRLPCLISFQYQGASQQAETDHA
jgi:hypothetical protein